MRVRLAQYEDASAIAHVLVDTFMASIPGILSVEAMQRRKEEWTYEVSTRAWQQTMVDIADGVSPLECLYVAEDEKGEVAGLAFACPSKDKSDPADVGEIDILYVRERNQRQGMGRALVQVTAAHLARLGMTKVHICTAEANAKGRRFYDKLGGQIIGTRDDYEDGELLVLVVYEWPDIQLLTK